MKSMSKQILITSFVILILALIPNTAYALSLSSPGKFTVKNHCSNKILTSFRFHLTGAAGFKVTSITNGDGSDLTGASYTMKPKGGGNGDVDIIITGMNLSKGESKVFLVHWNGSYHGCGGAKKDYKVNEDNKAFGGFKDTIGMDSDTIFGGATGITHLGVNIPIDTYGFFYQINNDDPSETVQSVSLNLSHSTQQPFGFGMLNYPHNGDRGAYGIGDDILPELLAIFEELDVIAGISPVSWSYDAPTNTANANFGAGIGFGERSNVFYFFSTENCDTGYLPSSELTATSGPETSMDILVPSILPIPTVSEWGMIVMCLMVVTAGVVVIRKRRLAA